MKKTLSVVLCLLLVLVTALTFAACTTPEEPADTTADTTAESSADTAGNTAAPETETVAPDTDAPETEAPETAESETEAPETTEDTAEPETDEQGNEYDPELYVVIRTAEDLMKFNEDVNINGVDYSFMTVLFLDDIDMTGYTWTPLDGFWLEDVVFDGQGHTISNLTFIDHVSNGLGLGDQGSGFIGINYYVNTFKNITFKDAVVNASSSHVGCIIGTNRPEDGGEVVFENVHVDGFKGNGTLEGIGTTIRVGGFIGSNNVGSAVFTDCSAKNLELSGFHNLCGFIGYDHTTLISEVSFNNCSVENCKFYFSYCQSESYTPDMPRKFVQVFYCATDWADNLDYVVERGNTFSEVYYYDWVDDNHEYRAEEFRSWTREEAAEAAAAG